MEALTQIYFPWYYFGAGVKLSLETERYRLSFVAPGEDGDLVSGLAAGKRWRAAVLKYGHGKPS